MTITMNYIKMVEYFIMQNLLGQFEHSTNKKQYLYWQYSKISYEPNEFKLTIEVDDLNTGSPFLCRSELEIKTIFADNLKKLVKNQIELDTTFDKEEFEWDRKCGITFADVFQPGIYVAQIYKLYDKLLERRINNSKYLIK